MVDALVVGMSYSAGGRKAVEGLTPVALRPLPSAPEIAVELTAALGSHPGVSLTAGSPRLDLSHDDLQREWRNAYEACARTGSALIVQFLGHGINGSTANSLFLAADNTDPERPAWTAADVDQWLKQVESTDGGPPVLFLLDVCGAGRAPMQQWLHGLSADRRRAWVIAACADNSKAYGARFSRATASVLTRLKAGWLDLSPAMRHVPVETFAREIDRELARLLAAEDKPPQRVLRTARAEADGPVPPFLENQGYRETPAGRYRQQMENGLWQFASAADPALDVVHFVSRASGSPHQQNVTRRCFFTGRRFQLRQLKEWLEDDQAARLMVVTGSPGSGKSALLGVLTCLAHEQLEEVSGSIRDRVPRHLRVERRSMLAAVHARQRDPAAVLASIAEQLGLGQAPLRGWSADEVLTRLRGAVGDRDRVRKAAEERREEAEKSAAEHPDKSIESDPREPIEVPPPLPPAVVIVDALDEASLDKELLSTVLLPLATASSGRSDGAPVCKVVVGVRPWWDRFPELSGDPRKASPHARMSVLNLDKTSGPKRTKELGNYLADLLEQAPAYTGPGSTKSRLELAQAVAQRLTTVRHRGSFLLASLFAHYLTEHDGPLTVEEAVRRVPEDLPGMLDLHLGVLTRQRSAVRSVLSALAHGLGEGMPLEVIHAVAGQLTADADEAPNLDDTRDAIEAASFYIRSAIDIDGRRLYRFFHQSLADHLAPASSDRRAVWHAVLGTVSGRDAAGEPTWDLALPYVQRHAAQHAADAGQLDGLLKSAAFLVHSDPTALRARLRDTRSLRARHIAEIIAPALSPQDDPWIRWEWLRHNAVVWNEDWLVRALDALRGTNNDSLAPLTLQWGSRTRALKDTRRFAEQAELATASDRPVAVTTHPDGHVWIRDALDGASLAVQKAGSGKRRPVFAVGVVGEATLMAISSGKRSLRLWNLNTNDNMQRLPLPNRPVAVAVGTLGGHPVVAACGKQDITVFSLPPSLSGEDLRVTTFPTAASSPYTAIAIADMDGTPTVLAGTAGGTLELWNADGTGHRSRKMHTASVRKVLPSRKRSGRHIVTCADDGIRVLSLDDGRVRELTATLGADQPVALLDLNGEEHVATTSDGQVEIRSVLDEPRRSQRHPYPEGTRIRALGSDGSRLLALAETRDFEVEVLNRLDTAGRLAQWDGHDSQVVSVALTSHRGRQFALSLSKDGVLHTWDTEDGLCLSSGRFRGAVTAAAGVVDGVPTAIVSTGQRTAWAVNLTNGVVTRSGMWDLYPRKLSWHTYRGTSAVAAHDSHGINTVVDAAEPQRVLLFTHVQPGVCHAIGDVGPLTAVTVYSSPPDPGGDSNLPAMMEVHDSVRTLSFRVSGEPAATTMECHQETPVLVSGFADGLVVGRDLVSRHIVFSFHNPDKDLHSIHTMPSEDSFHVVTASRNGTIRVWDPFDGAKMLAQVEVPDQIGPIAVSPRGVLAASGSRISYFSWSQVKDEPQEAARGEEDA
ncbi:hypothetical protein [Streptomyces canus]|uniref:hypothetical protein n=1 Tax=Streptomyces canus TaxID=58343 RepID=UPI0003661C48|nr:hypothetical protein [Streptomyces canus]